MSEPVDTGDRAWRVAMSMAFGAAGLVLAVLAASALTKWEHDEREKTS